MDKREYIDSLMEQIRCKKARTMIAEEINAHIEDQIVALESKGMERENATKESVRQMGDPVKTGLELDRIHRPKIMWSFLIIIVALSISGCIIQSLLMVHISETEKIPNVVLYTLLGMLICLGVFYIDYTFIGKYTMGLWGCITVWILWNTCFQLYKDYNTVHQIISGSLTIAIPLYAGVIFYFREKRVRGILYSLVLLVPLCWAGLNSANSTATLELGFSCLIMISIAIWRGWYGTRLKACVFIIWMTVLGIPGIVLMDVFLNAGKQTLIAQYQLMRLMAFLNPSNYAESIGYKTLEIQKLLSDSSLIGGSKVLGYDADVLCNDYIITSIFSYFGLLTGVVVLFTTGLMLVKAFHITFHQRNRLGYLLGIGCSMSLLIKIGIYVAANFGIVFFSQTTMPFLSYGIVYTIVNAFIVGVLLSVYRNSNILSEKDCSHTPRKRESTI